MTTTTVTHDQVAQQARQWIDTPFHHQGRLRGVGVDCIGLVIGVARDLELVAPDFDITGYSRWPDGTSLMAQADRHMQRLAIDEPLAAGHVVVVDFRSDPCHFGILVPYRHGGLAMVHAAARSGRVLETRLLLGDAMRFVAAFALPGVEG